MASTKHLSFRRICAATCGVELEVESGRLVGLRGDREHPLSAGYLCLKGRASLDLHNGEDRLVSSRRRSGDGAVTEIDTEAALDEIHLRLADIVRTWGPRSVALYYGTGVNLNTLTTSAVKAWMAGLGSPYIYSSMSLDQSAKQVAAARMDRYLGGKRNVLDADVLMMVGSNPAVSHANPLVPCPNPLKALRDARQSGMKFNVVNPRLTETAREVDIHLRVRPGEDATLFAGLIHIVLDLGLEDREVCDRFAGSLDPLRAAVAEFEPQFVSRRTGIPREVLNETALVFANAARKSAQSSTRPDMATDANVSEHLIEAFNAICGGYRRAGDKAWNVGGVYANIRPEAAVAASDGTWERGPKCVSVDAGPLSGEYPTALLPGEILHPGDDRIRALIVVGGDPARALPDPKRTVAALEALDLLVTVDNRPTDTGAWADYEIATSLPYERHDLTALLDPIYPETFAQVTTPALERPAGILDDWEVLWGLARRAGTPMHLKQAIMHAPHDPDQQLPTSSTHRHRHQPRTSSNGCAGLAPSASQPRGPALVASRRILGGHRGRSGRRRSA